MAAAKNAYTNTLQVMEDWGIAISEAIVSLLERKNKIASGKLSNSIDYDTVEDPQKNQLYLVIKYAYHGKYVLEGRKPNTRRYRRGQGTGAPSPFIQAIIQWIRDKKIPVRLSSGKKSGRTRKLTKFGQEKSLAFAIANSINKKSIKPFNFLLPYEEAIEEGEMQKEIRQALVKDGYKSLKQPILNFNKKQQQK